MMKENNIKDREFAPDAFDFVQKDSNIHDQKFDTKPVSFLRDALRRFGKNKSSVIAACIIMVLLLFAMIGVEISPYSVDFQDNFLVGYRPLIHGLEWLGFDGTYVAEIPEADYYAYLAVGVETGNNPIKKVIDDYDKVVMQGTLEITKHWYKVEIDSYYSPGNVYKLLTKDEYIELQKYQDNTGIQVIFPYYSNYNNDTSSLDQYNANKWYNIVETGLKKGNPIGIKADGTIDWSVKYNAYGYDKPESDANKENFPLDDGYFSKMRVEGENVYKYNYATLKGANGNQVEVRVNYYRYFEYKNGRKPVFWFGTNQYGQDIFVRLAAGARFSFLLALFVSAINLTIGAIYGAIEGYYGGKVDMVMERIVEILGGVPFMVVVTLFKMHLAAKVGMVACLLFAFVTTGWIGESGTVRTQFYRFKGQEYILAARTLGAKDGRLMFKHIFPNAIGTVITGSVLAIPGVIFSESTLSYLGIINLNTSKITSVGTLLSNSQQAMQMGLPHILLFPALFISLLMISFNLFGNGLRDAFNPSLRGSEG